MPIFAWLKSGPPPPVKPNLVPFHCPDVAIWTSPGSPRASSQQSIGVSARVEQILGFAHHVAVLSETPKTAETICHAGTLRCEGFDSSCTPVERRAFTTVLLSDFTP